jgi:ribosomal protein S27E
MEPNPADVEQYQCPGCGADMTYNPAKGQLNCSYCGYLETLSADPQAAVEQARQEHTLRDFLDIDQNQLATLSTNAQEAECPGCRAQVTFDPPDVAGKCPFCGTSIVTQAQPAHPVLAPAGLIPFKVGRKAATQELRAWLAFRFDLQDWQAMFIPGQLKRMAQQESLVGIYLPFWTFDSQTSSQYRGERGEYYYVTEKDSDGNTKRVRKTRWHRASGHVSRFFDDVLVPATRSVDNDRLSNLWRSISAASLSPYKSEYLAGFKAQRYEVPVKQGWADAKVKIDEGIKSAVRADIGGDVQRVHSVSTQYSQQTFKHILLPVWMLGYRYQGKVYQVMINGDTGKVVGERPFSAWKIALAATLASIITLLVLYMQTQ